jgi:hypothetical protein
VPQRPRKVTGTVKETVRWMPVSLKPRAQERLDVEVEQPSTSSWRREANEIVGKEEARLGHSSPADQIGAGSGFDVPP